MDPLKKLQPTSVWTHFAALCSIPHPSRHEAALRAHLIGWAEARGIGCQVDAAGNLILRKSASPGCEASPGVILQGHLDMVCQADAGTRHDFLHDAIAAEVRDGWVAAGQTTLGADNGVGVALALAVLEEPGLVHPALEVLLTVNEEAGMDGARGLAPGTLEGRVLLNLDTEEWGCFYLGCAGGVDVEVRSACRQCELPTGCELVRLEVSGLRGGHSGIDIHLGRGNAILLLVEALRDLSAHTDICLVEMQGGSARNAIPREASALVAVADVARAQDAVRRKHGEWRERLAKVDANVSLALERLPPVAERLFGVEPEPLLEFIATLPGGVVGMSPSFAGVVETSGNLGVAALRDGAFSATLLVRSLLDSRADELADALVAHAAACGFQAWKEGAYPGWTPDPSSALLALCQRVFAAEFGRAATLQVIHAGLECGLLAASHPHLDMISFGPDIRGAHAPGERVEIESVACCWHLLKALLAALAGKYPSPTNC